MPYFREELEGRCCAIIGQERENHGAHGFSFCDIGQCLFPRSADVALAARDLRLLAEVVQKLQETAFVIVEGVVNHRLGTHLVAF